MAPISFKEKIENHAQTIAKRYGLSSERVLALLFKTTCLSYGTPIKVSDFNSVPAHENPEFNPSLFYVFGLLQPNPAEAEDILNLFEHRKLDVLASRLTLYKNLSPISQPLYSRNELISILNSFLVYLASNKEFLIAHGIPKTRFYQSPWLDEELRNLYFTRALVVKFKAAPFKERESSLDEYERDFDYDEPQIEIHSFAKSDGSFPRSTGLEPQDESFLINKRELLFGIKRSVIEKAVELLTSNKSESLWSETNNIFSDKLSKDDINRLTELDEVISNYSIFNIDTSKSEFPNSGGFQNILSVLAHLEDEINHSWFSKMRELLTPYLFLDDFFRQRLNFKSFYADLSNLKPNGIDQASDLYREWQAHQDKWRLPFLRNSLIELTDMSSTNVKKSISAKGKSDEPLIQEENLEWHEINIHFISDDAVNVCYRGKEKKFYYYDFGLTDKKRSYPPYNSVWVFFKEYLARNSGFINASTKDIPGHVRDQMPKTISLLTTALERVFGIENPFPHYRKHKEYRTKFMLIDDTPKNPS